MRKLLLATIVLLVVGIGIAVSQQVFMPPPAGTIAILCARNTTPQTITTGQVGFVQCDVNGNLIITASPSGVTNENLAQVGGNTVVTAGVNGLLAVGGNVASSAADSGNPVKAGCVYNATLPAPTTGQRVDAQCDSNGNWRIIPMMSSLTPGDSVANTNSAALVSSKTADSSSRYQAVFPWLFNGTSWDRYRSVNGADNAIGTGVLGIAAVPVSTQFAAIVPTATGVISSTFIPTAVGANLYGVEVTTVQAGFFMIFDSATVPGDGAVTPKYCKIMSANSSAEVSWSPPARFSTGIAMAFSTVGCFTKTATPAAFISAMTK